MTVQFFGEEDVIEVGFVPVLITGPPGSWKTSLIQTAHEPLTLDFDRGIHRCKNRRAVLRFTTQKENLDAAGQDGIYCYPAGHKKAGEPIPYHTLGVDTGGRLLDAIEAEVIRESPAKNPWAYRGSLSQVGWGELGRRFRGWLNQVRRWGKQIVVVCHQDSKYNKATEVDELCPDLPGKMAWKEVHKAFDLIGCIRYDGSQRILDFNPSESAPFCKNSAQLPAQIIPDLHQHKTFLADLIAQAKANIGKTAAASAEVARIVTEWRDWLDTPLLSLDQFNARLPSLAALTNGVKVQVKHLCETKAREWELVWDKQLVRYVPQPVPDDTPESKDGNDQQGD